jgi:hypothetical protein
MELLAARLMRIFANAIALPEDFSMTRLTTVSIPARLIIILLSTVTYYPVKLAVAHTPVLTV